MAKVRLVVKSSTRPAQVTDLVPGDSIYRDGTGGIITGVEGRTKDGILTWRIYYGLQGKIAMHQLGHFEFMYKLCKV